MHQAKVDWIRDFGVGVPKKLAYGVVAGVAMVADSEKVLPKIQVDKSDNYDKNDKPLLSQS